MKIDLKQIHQLLNAFMSQVNDLLVKKFSQPKKISYKTGGVDHLGTSVVTQVDHQVEAMLRQKLTKILPGSGFIGEESAADVKEYNWIVDPIDGTLNYANQVPVFACSVALWQGNVPIYAYVSLPLVKETVHAISGQGLWLNGRPVKLPKKLVKKLFLTYSCVAGSHLQKRVFETILQFTSSPRIYGSCVFHGTEISLGRIDGGVFINQAIWDIGAIVLLAQEAGLTVKYVSGQPKITSDDLKNYQYSLVIGPEKLANNLAAKL